MKRFSTASDGSSGQEFASYMLRALAGRTLNLGAGSGLKGPRVINVDHVMPTNVQGTFVLADVGALPFRDGSFDSALVKDVLEHTWEPVPVLEELRRVLREGGVASITVPRAVPRAVWGDPTHIRGFTAGALKKVLTLSGWVAVIEPSRIGGFPGAGKLGLEPYLGTIMRLPLLGHYFGVNWWVKARAT